MRLRPVWGAGACAGLARRYTLELVCDGCGLPIADAAAAWVAMSGPDHSVVSVHHKQLRCDPPGSRNTYMWDDLTDFLRAALEPLGLIGKRGSAA